MNPPTPRVDAACWSESGTTESELVHADFARALKRELAEARAEAVALLSLQGIPEEQCLACGGTGGHEEGCRGTTALIAMQRELAEAKAEIKKVNGYRERLRQRLTLALDEAAELRATIQRMKRT